MSQKCAYNAKTRLQEWLMNWCWPRLLKLASGETIHWSYECWPLLGIFLCVKNAEPCWRLVKLSQSFFDIVHNSLNLQKVVKIFLKIASDYQWISNKCIIHYSNDTTWSQILIIGSDIRFFTKEICPYYCCFLHTKKG